MSSSAPNKCVSACPIWAVTILILVGLTPLIGYAYGLLAAFLFALLVVALAYAVVLLQRCRDASAQLTSMRENERQLQTITSSLPLFLYRCRNDTDWTTLFKTDGCKEITGYAASDFLSGQVRYGSLIAESYRDIIWKKWQEGLDQKEPVEMDYPIRHADGKDRWVWERGHGVYNAAGELVFIEGLVLDISDRKQAEEERDRLLKESDKMRRTLLSVLEDERRGQAERIRLASAVEQSQESIVITDTAGIIQYVNPAFTESSGYARDEAVGHHVRMLKSGKETSRTYRNMWRSLARGNPWSGRIVNQRKDGSLFTEHVTISAVTNQAGEITNYVAVKRDMTHEIELEQQLLHSQKMEIIGQMAGGIAHDFNNNLQAIMGFNDLAMEDHDDPEVLKEYLAEIRKAGESASSLTRQLLAFSRKQVLAKQVLNLNDLISNMTEMIRRTIGENVELQWRPQPAVGEINGDPGQLEQVIFNLVLNAKDAMPEGGRLSILLSSVEFTEDDLSIHPDARLGQFACVAVADTGVGIPTEIRAKIFDPFFTTKPASKGTGLGLSSVYGIVKQHDGWLTVYSEENEGSEFHIYLPLAQTDQSALGAALDELSEEELKGHGERILVVEDEDSIRELMRKILVAAGYEVVCAASAEDGEALYEQHPGTIDLVLSDVVLPKRSGFDMVASLKEKNPHLKVLMVSGYTDERTRWSLICEKGWRYLQKPVKRKLLLKVLHEILKSPPELESD